jgi:hypothetical protein
LEWLGIVLEGVRGCWTGVGAAWNMLECVGVAWNGVGVVLEWLGIVLEGVRGG